MKIKKYKADLILAAAVLIIGLAVGGVLLLTQKKGAYVQVRVSGEVIAEYALDQEFSCTLVGKDGGTNELVIQNGEAWLTGADCPDELCVGMGKISKSGQSIVCLPHEMIIEVIDDSGEQSMDVDIVVG